MFKVKHSPKRYDMLKKCDLLNLSKLHVKIFAIFERIKPKKYEKVCFIHDIGVLCYQHERTG